MWQEYITAASIEEATRVLREKGTSARIVAGATDLLLEIERGARPGVDTLIDITRIPNLDYIRFDDGTVRIGALATHNQCAASSVIEINSYLLMRACWEVGSPQIRNRATVAGNLITASPANDTITPLMALGASVTLVSADGERQVALADFYTGVRKTVMRPDEILTEISFPALDDFDQPSVFIKYALRRAQAISVINLAVILSMDGPQVRNARITLGAVAPTIIHAAQAEQFLAGKTLSEEVILEAARLAREDSRPIDDLRGSAAYRREMVRVCAMRALGTIRDHRIREGMPAWPVLLDGGARPAPAAPGRHVAGTPIETRINGRAYTFTSGHDKTLLRLLREEGGLTGSKEGCAEGECGACTVFLDGRAVMACLVPAPRAHRAEIVTVEGLADGERLHPVQQAFVEAGAVQCGYCTPGFVMSAAKLLEERAHPVRNEIEQALSGNLCRCTGYYKILQAVEVAGHSPTRGDA